MIRLFQRRKYRMPSYISNIMQFPFLKMEQAFSSRTGFLEIRCISNPYHPEYMLWVQTETLQRHLWHIASDSDKPDFHHCLPFSLWLGALGALYSKQRATIKSLKMRNLHNRQLCNNCHAVAFQK